MPFEAPTLNQIIAQQESDFYIENGGAPAFPANDIAVFSRTTGGVAHGLYGYVQYKATQANPATATEAADVERHASWWGVTRKQATAARGQAIAPQGTQGTLVPAGTVLQAEAAAGSVQLLVAQSVELAADKPTTVELIAATPGAAGNLPGGTRLRLAQTIPGAPGTWQIAPQGLALGTDDETTPRLAARLSTRVKQPPQGGALHDYTAWALTVPGVTRAWSRANWVGRGTIGVLVVNDDAPDLAPSPELIAQAQSYISDPARLPPGAEPFVLAPAFVPVVFRIAGLFPALPEVRRAVEESLLNTVYAESEPGGTLLISHLREVVSQSAGEYDHALLAPAGNLTFAQHEMPVYGGVEWVE